MKITDYADDTGESLETKIASSAVFLVLASKNYINGVKHKHVEVTEPERIAKKLSKDTVVLIDRKLSEEDKGLLKEHLSGLNIIRQEVMNVYDFNSVARIMSEINNAYDVGDADAPGT